MAMATKTTSPPDGQGLKEPEQEEDVEEIVIEQPLLTIKEVFVYKVPPLRASSGHRAEEWGLATPVFTGVLKIVQVGDICCLRLLKPPPEGELGAVPELFAQCEVRLEGGRTLQVYVESVIDSSRYFVIRCEDKASGRHAYIGIGFRERSSAFDFKAVLDDFVRFLDRQRRAEESSAVEQQREGREEALGPVKPVKDLSIAEGQKLHIGLKVGSNGAGAGAGGSRTRRRPRSEATAPNAAKGGGGMLLAPPPLPGATYKGTSVALSPPPLVSPRTARTATSSSGVRQTAAKASLPASEVEPPDLSEEAGGVASGEGIGDSRGGGDDDDGWGEFESA